MSVRQGNKVIAGNAPIYAGFIATFAGSVTPIGWLACDGSAISRTDYADLFAAIGTTYGSGDGSTTFNIPDYTDLKKAGLPDYDNVQTLSSGTGNYNGTAPADGYISARSYGAWANVSITINSVRVDGNRSSSSDQYGRAGGLVPVKKGDTISIGRTSSSGDNQGVYFYPMKGTDRPSHYCIKY